MYRAVAVAARAAGIEPRRSRGSRQARRAALKSTADRPSTASASCSTDATSAPTISAPEISELRVAATRRSASVRARMRELQRAAGERGRGGDGRARHRHRGLSRRRVQIFSRCRAPQVRAERRWRELAAQRRRRSRVRKCSRNCMERDRRDQRPRAGAAQAAPTTRSLIDTSAVIDVEAGRKRVDGNAIHGLQCGQESLKRERLRLYALL